MIQRKFGQLCAGAALLLLSFGAHAQWTAGINYTHLDLDEVELGAIVGSFGYRFPAADNFYIVPEVRIGFGVGDDNFSGFTVEVDKLYGAASRFEFEFHGGAYLFGVVSYVNYELKGSGMGVSVSDDSWEAGFGGGAGYMFTPALGAEISYENVDSENVYSIGLRFNF